MSHEPLSLSRRGALQALLAGILIWTAVPALAGGGGKGLGNSGNGNSGIGNGGGDDGGARGDDADEGSDDGGDSGDDADEGSYDGGDEGSQAREAVRSGDAASLKDILAVVRQKYRGQVVRVRLESSGDGLFYNIRFLDSGNRLFDITVNAKSRLILAAGSTVY